MKNFPAREQFATRGMTHGFDRDDSWVHGTLPLSPEEFTQSSWSEVNALKNAISMPARARPWPNTMKFVDGLSRDLPDEVLAAIKRFVERRSHEAAQVIVTPVSTAQHCIPRSLDPEIPSDVYVDMEEKDEGRMNPELTELEIPSTGTGLETLGHQCTPKEGIWEKGRTITDGYLLVGMGSNQGEDISLPTERVDTPAVRTTTTTSNSSNTIFQQQGHKPKNKDEDSEENKQFDPEGKERNHRLGTRL